MSTPRRIRMMTLSDGTIITSLSTKILELRSDHIREFVNREGRWRVGRWFPLAGQIINSYENK